VNPSGRNLESMGATSILGRLLLLLVVPSS
jgi:hypothetical protein